MDYQLTSRRRVLTAVGTGTTVALAGCSGNGQGGTQPEGSDDDGTEQNGGSDSDQSNSGDENGSDEPESTGNERGEYPNEETTGTEAEFDRSAEKDPLFSFRIDNYDFLNIQEFPEAEFEDPTSYSKALYFSANLEGGKELTDQIYFLCSSIGEKGISFYSKFYSKTEDGSFDISKGIFASEETSELTQEEFLSQYVDPDGIDHAVDLDEHEYAMDALHSGFGSE